MASPTEYVKRFVLFFWNIILSLLAKFWSNRYLNDIVFNCAWEDPVVDKQVLDLSEHDEILVITSAGCNVLSMLLDKPNHIYSIDRNPCQNALLNLKIAAIKELEYEDFWKIFGEGRFPGFTKLYKEKLRQHLSSEAQAFWDTHAKNFEPGYIRDSFYYHGGSGMMAFLIRCYMKVIPGLYQNMVKMISCDTIEQQKELYESKIKGPLWGFIALKVLGSSQAMNLTGVPPPQQLLLKSKGGPGPFMKEQFDYLVNNILFKTNYFYVCYILGRYTKDACPEYLVEKNFKRLKEERLYERVSTHTQLISDFLKEHKKHHKINRWILLDHMDWMSENNAPLREEWELIFSSTQRPAKVLFRSASVEAEFVRNTEVTVDGKTSKVKDLLEFKDEIANKLHLEDRVHTYTSFHVADIPAK